jgi:hypothetical protein
MRVGLAFVVLACTGALALAPPPAAGQVPTDAVSFTMSFLRPGTVLYEPTTGIPIGIPRPAQACPVAPGGDGTERACVVGPATCSTSSTTPEPDAYRERDACRVQAGDVGAGCVDDEYRKPDRLRPTADHVVACDATVGTTTVRAACADRATPGDAGAHRTEESCELWPVRVTETEGRHASPEPSVLTVRVGGVTFTCTSKDATFYVVAEDCTPG